MGRELRVSCEVLQVEWSGLNLFLLESTADVAFGQLDQDRRQQIHELERKEEICKFEIELILKNSLKNAFLPV